MEGPEPDASPFRRWLGGAGGAAEVLAVAAPMVVSSLSWTVMTFVDRLMLRHDSGDAMSAAFTAGTAWFAAICLPMGVCAYTNTFVAQHHGAGQRREIGPAVWQGVWIALIASPLLLAAIPLAPWLFSAAQHGERIAELQTTYFAVLCWGAPAMLVSQSLASFYSGRGLTLVVMVVDAFYALLNVLLDYWWIFGLEVGGAQVFPAAGIAGAAWATVVALWLKTLTYGVLVTLPRNRRDFATGALRLQPKRLTRMLYFGGPSGVQMLVEVLGFTAFIFLVGALGAVENEATTMAFSVSTLAFMPVWGLSMAASILVGQHLGENRDHAAARATWTTLYVALAYMAVVSSLYVLTPWMFLDGFFKPEQPSENDAAIRAAAVLLLQFVAAYNLLDATQMVFVHAVKGAGDTRFVLVVSTVAAAVLSLACWVAIEWFGAGLYACWALVVLWVWALGVAYAWRFLGGKWRSMRVIEQPPT
ncbi:MAG: MATE family efflux transporter [Lacipirellulaceae bacterium]